MNTVSLAGRSPVSVAAEAPTIVATSGEAGGRRRVPQAAQNASVAEMLAAQLGQLLGTVVWGARSKIFRADYAMPTPSRTRIGARRRLLRVFAGRLS